MNTAYEFYETAQQKADRARLVWQQAVDDSDRAKICFDEAIAERARAKKLKVT